MEVAERFAGWLEVADVRAVLPMRPRFGHKGDFGHALLMAGSTGYQGAAVLAAQGCARSGVGLFTVHGPAETVRLVGTALPDAMASVDPAPDHLTELPDVHRASAIGIGPGLGTAERTAAVVEQLLHAGQGRLVLDADALNILASKRELLGHMPPHTILTPHPKEMDRLLGGVSASAFERLLLAKRFAQEHACYIVLKGAYTATCAPHGQVYFNPTGNVGMAKGGSGDVLAGLLTGLLAQGLPPVEACLLGVYLHGLAGDLAAQHLGVDAMRASDLVRQLPAAWKQLRATAGQGL
jgi:NAD(P)H-hydrate epimerase